MTKREQIIDAIQKENWRVAFKIGSKFTRDFNKDEQGVIQRAHEIEINGISRIKFYRQLGFDIEDIIIQAKQILIKTYRRG